MKTLLSLLIGGTAIFLWFLWAIDQAREEEEPIRAISAAMHDACASLPHGNQEMENERRKCFKQLYAQGKFRIDRELVGND